ncbi:Mbov_0399 family ICE element protein [Spiroplasma sp. AdecLV25b]|uniref:Mbov_0399 family ICE element protein n=1 Tax=Spiroplasma sp. AdecLV25b TaxID=3027162 RepID=UPI0027E01A96|nr:hypothetical protein [Spiroplasma sp. AdecLV25b]
MKRFLLFILLILVPTSLFTSGYVQSNNLANVNQSSIKNKQPYNYLINNSYDTSLSFHQSYCPSDWWGTLEDNTNYFSIPNYYTVTSVDITFSLQFNRGYGWYTKTFNFNSDMINTLNQGLKSGQTYFATDNYAWQGQSGAYLYWQFKLTINNSTNQWFDPNWGGWASWTRVGGLKYDAIIHVHNNWQEKTDAVNSKLNSYLNNHTLNLDSDFSASLLDNNNKKSEEQALDQLLQQALTTDYQTWKGYLQPYAYDDSTGYATLTFKFQDITKNYQQVVWVFKVKITFHLTQTYWDKTIGSRLTITPGKLVNPNDPNGAMIDDTPLNWKQEQVYGTTASLVFGAATDESEYMTVNDQPVQVLNHRFTYNMTDKQGHTDDKGQPTNEYDIKLFKDNVQRYQVKYLIKQDTPELSNQWYAWNPNNNPDQKELISPTNPDGSNNPKYDREVNPKTGTKTQIVWIKHQAENPFPLDPIDKDGKFITDKNYDQGFLAEGSVSGMGVKQIFNDDWIKSVSRETVNNELNSTSTKTIINSDKDGHYWSSEGIYHYTVTNQKDGSSNKYVIIGAPYQNHYPRFLDVLNDSNVAVNFWTTIHGLHLKNYLITYKKLNSEAMQKLSFEDVASYWKEYVSDLSRNAIPPDPQPVNYVDLNKISFDTIKMNLTTIDLIRNEIVFQINKALNKYYLVNNIDYEIKPLDNTSLKQLLNFKTVGDIQEAKMTISINSLDTSSRAIGNTTIKFINSPQYNPKTVVDLSSIKMQTWEYNFKTFSITKMRQWILTDISNELITHGGGILKYNFDYSVSNLDDKTLTDFLDNSKGTKTLTFTIAAFDESMKAQGSTSLTLINNPNATPAPPEPPTPPDPNPPVPTPHPNWFSNGYNLAWFLPLTIGTIGISLGLGYYLYVRNKKGIGGKKIKSKK